MQFSAALQHELFWKLRILNWMLFVKKVISFYYSPDVCTLLFSPKLFLMAETKHETNIVYETYWKFSK